ncbi:myosin regulatory light chain 2, atrial isoform 2-T2 [Megaptera novaeangliae]
MFEQAQIQEFKEAFSCIDQNRDGIICKSDLRETYSQLGKVNVPEEELDAMLQEGKGPINFTVFLTLFGEKLNGSPTSGGQPVLAPLSPEGRFLSEQPLASLGLEDSPCTLGSSRVGPGRWPCGCLAGPLGLPGTDPEEAILSAFRLFDPSGKGVVNRDEFKQLLLTQADKFSLAEAPAPRTPWLGSV